MSIGVLVLILRIPGCASLKEKRGRLKPLLAKLQKEYKLSAAEVDDHDIWGRSVVACALVSNSANRTRRSWPGRCPGRCRTSRRRPSTRPVSSCPRACSIVRAPRSREATGRSLRKAGNGPRAIRPGCRARFFVPTFSRIASICNPSTASATSRSWLTTWATPCSTIRN